MKTIYVIIEEFYDYECSSHTLFVASEDEEKMKIIADELEKGCDDMHGYEVQSVKLM